MQVVTLFSPRSIRPICLPEFPTRNPRSSWVIFLANLSSRTLFPRAFRKSLSTTFCTYKSGSLKITTKAHVWVIFVILIIFALIRKDPKNRNNRCFCSLITTQDSKQITLFDMKKHYSGNDILAKYRTIKVRGKLQEFF